MRALGAIGVVELERPPKDPPALQEDLTAILQSAGHMPSTLRLVCTAIVQTNSSQTSILRIEFPWALPVLGGFCAVKITLIKSNP